MDTVRSEDTIVFLALDPQTTKMHIILDALKHFFAKKQEIDATDRFNVVMFIENGPIYFEDFTHNTNYILEAIQDYIIQMQKQNVAGGIFVAVTFLIDVFKIVGGKTFRLLILTDKSTPKMQNIEVVKDLVDKVTDFPFYIDVIRIESDDPGEDLKFMKLVKNTGGSVYYAKNERETENILLKLTEKKPLRTHGFSSQLKLTIDPENESFFENLAEKPIPISINEENDSIRCQICGKNENLYKCSKCGVTNHLECLAQWAKFSHVGLRYVFRCQNCFNLLKLDREFVEKVQSDSIDKKKGGIQNISQDDWLSEQETALREKSSGDLKIVQGQSPFPETSSRDIYDGDENVFDFQDDGDLVIVFCPKCGKMLTSEYKFCIGCGIKIK